jgi:hypothetical protein
MTSNVITSVEQVTTEWLTAMLSNSGAITAGAVASFTVGTGVGNWSSNANLTLSYTADAKGECPTHLFLKLVNTDAGDGEFFDDSEVRYYTEDYVDVPNAPLLKNYGGAYSPTLNRYHLLLEDVSATHVEASSKPKTLSSGLALAEGLAVLHARWWGEKGLAEAGVAMHTPEFIQQFVDIAQPGVANVFAQVADNVPPHWHDLTLELFAKHPTALKKRIQNPNGFTLVHGDVNSKNILLPREGDQPLYIIDRQPFNWSLTTWLGVYDIAYAIGLFWETANRRQHEIAILKRYHECLLENGVTGYMWEQLYDDYRLCLAMGVYVATEWCRGGYHSSMKHVWFMELQRSLTACDDLNCRELWL